MSEEEHLKEKAAQCYEMPHGREKIQTYERLIQEADRIQSKHYRKYLRWRYAAELMGYGDPGKVFPTVIEYIALREEEVPTEEQYGDTELLFMADYGMEVLGYLPQIPLAQAEALLEKFEQIIRFQGWGMRLYYQRAFRFYGDINTQKALEQFQKFQETRRDSFSDCKACEQADMVRLFFRMGDFARAEELARPVMNGTLKCHEVPRNVWYLYLQKALDDGDRKKAASLADSIYAASEPEDPSDLGYLGAVLRCWAFTAPEEAAGLLERCLPRWGSLWDQDKRFSFAIGAWTYCRLQKDSIQLDLPRTIPLWREDRIYRPKDLAPWFYQQAADIASRYDARNGTDRYTSSLERAVSSLEYQEGQRFWLEKPFQPL